MFAGRGDLSRVVLMCGLPASGKTTTAEWIHRSIGGALIRSCDVYAALGIDLPAWVTRTRGFTVGVDGYLAERDRAYDVMARELAAHLATTSGPVIVDAVHGERTKRQRLYDVCAAHAAAATLVWCRCDDANEVARRFRARRGRERSPENEASDLSVHAHILGLWQDPREDPLVVSGVVGLLVHDTAAREVSTS